MQADLQIKKAKREIDRLQKLYGGCDLRAIYGAGCTSNPKLLFLFMNPTARNISSSPDWSGLRAPWVGTKNIWKVFKAVGLLDKDIVRKIEQKEQNIWTEGFVLELYGRLSQRSVYVTNLAKCTQDDARALRDQVFKAYLQNTLDEIYEVNPAAVISFGNQASSVLLGRGIKVSDYIGHQKEILRVKNKKFDVYPTFYPIGQGMRNIDQAIARIESIIEDNSR